MTTLTITVIVAFFTALIVLGIGNMFAGSTAAFLSGQVSEVEAGLIVNTATVLHSMPGGEATLETQDYLLRYNADGEEPTIDIQRGGRTVSAPATHLTESYGSINAPREFESTEGEINLRKEREDGEEILVIDVGG